MGKFAASVKSFFIRAGPGPNQLSLDRAPHRQSLDALLSFCFQTFKQSQPEPRERREPLTVPEFRTKHFFRGHSHKREFLVIIISRQQDLEGADRLCDNIRVDDVLAG